MDRSLNSLPSMTSVPEPKHLDWIEASDHFFKGGLDSYERVIEQIGRKRQHSAPSESMPRKPDTPLVRAAALQSEPRVG